MAVDPSPRCVNDLRAANCKQLLNAYVYDFLIKSSLPQTAQSFVLEADVPTGAPSIEAVKRPAQKELLPLAVSLDAPQGFLYEWWQIFWDVFNARTHRGGSENAQHYYQLQLLRQHKEHALYNSTFHAAHAQTKAQQQAFMGHPQQQVLLQQQHQQQLLLQQQQQQQQQHHQPQSQAPMASNPQFMAPGQQQFNQFGQMPMVPMPGVPNPSQMSPHHLQPSLQQQEVQQHFQQQQTQLFAGQKRVPVMQGPGGPMNQNYARVQQAQMQMNQLRQQQQQQTTFPANSQFKTPQLGANNNGQRTNSPNKKVKLEDSNSRDSPMNGNNLSDTNSPLPHKLNANTNHNVSSPAVTDVNDQETGTTGQRALQDYQLQLMALERENKKMLNGSRKSSVSEAAGKTGKKAPSKRKKMPPPKKTKGAPGESPVPSKKTVGTSQAGTPNATTPSAGPVPKKAATRRKTKKNTKGNNTSEPPTPTTPLTPSAGANVVSNTANPSILKKESSTISKLGPNVDFKDNEKDETPSNGSQLTPPNSENATTNANLEEKKEEQPFAAHEGPEFSEDHKGFPPDDEIISGTQMIGGGHNDLYSDFPLSDFSNEISGDGNFNLETFLNTDGSDLGSFDNYWRDGVEATD